MFTVRVPARHLFERIAAEAHSPEFLAVADTLASSGVPSTSLGELVAAPINNSIRDVDGELNAPGADIPMYRPADMAGGWLDSDTAPRLTRAFEAHHAKSRVIPGDIVLAIAGTVAEVGRVPPMPGHGNVNGSSARIRPRNGVAGYLLAYLRSKFGRLSLLRYAVGSVQRHLNLEDLPQLAVALPGHQAQRYIGVKIRQAEQLRERARDLEGASRRALSCLVLSRREAESALAGLQQVLDGAAFARAADARATRAQVPVLHASVSPELLFGRLNAEAYQGAFLENDRLLRVSGWPLKPLRELVTAPINNSIRGVTEHLTGSHEGVPMFRPADINGLWMNASSAPRIDAAFEQAHAKARVVSGDMVLAIAGTVASVARIGEGCSHANINGSSARLRLAEPMRGFALFFLDSIYGRRSLMRLAVGSVQKHLNLEDLPDVHMPVPDPEHCAPFERALVLSGRAHRFAGDLLTAATQLVEGLVDGTIAERDVVAAAHAMDSGGDATDVALLNELKDPISGGPLFPDVGALFDAIADAAPSGGEGR